MSLAAGEAGVDASVSHQRISGFGASSAWTLPAASDELADRFFSVENGIGLSLLRVRITPNGTTDELVTAQKAVARGASVWAAPWSPPGAWKTGTDPQNPLWGGSLLPEHRKPWAERLAKFVVDMRDAGVPLLALSAQNEPNWTDRWETCRWTPRELTDFVRDELGPALANAGVSTPILAPETNDWSSVASFANPLLQDANVLPLLGPIATHAYGNAPPYEFKTPAQYGKELWETEVSFDPPTPDPGIDAALNVAEMIHDHLTIARVSAWHYWWLMPVSASTGSGALTQNGELTKRAYVLGQYSRFVRPGFVRVKATAEPQRQVKLTAFSEVGSQGLVLVALNTSSEDKTQVFVLANATSPTFTPYTTSASLALAAGEPVTASAGKLTVVLPARSVTTFVGKFE
ncbi:MAG: glycoside hydrolase family 30 protein [Myxococcota bacterium]